jgi:hypothetical protein
MGVDMKARTAFVGGSKLETDREMKNVGRLVYQGQSLRARGTLAAIVGTNNWRDDIFSPDDASPQGIILQCAG